MATPILGLTELVSAQALPEVVVNENVRWLEFFASGAKITDRDDTAPPGSPVDGEAYLVKATATGAWAGQDNKIALYISSAWAFMTPTEGMTLYVADEDIRIQYDGSAWAAFGGSSAQYRNISFFFTSTPTSSEVLLLYTACESITLADDFAGSVGDVGTNPTASFALDVQKNGSSIGTITISTGGAFTFATTGASVSLVSGDQVKIVAPASVDATVADVSITLKGAL